MLDLKYICNYFKIFVYFINFRSISPIPNESNINIVLFFLVIEHQ